MSWSLHVTPHLCFISAGVSVSSKVKGRFCLFPAGPQSWKLHGARESVAAGGLWVMVHYLEERGLNFGMKANWLVGLVRRFCTYTLVLMWKQYEGYIVSLFSLLICFSLKTQELRTPNIRLTYLSLLLFSFWAILLVSYSNFCFQWAFRHSVRRNLCF